MTSTEITKATDGSVRPNVSTTTVQSATPFYTWYKDKFSAITNLPLPASVAVQWLMWMGWGFAWIPFYYNATKWRPISVTASPRPSQASDASRQDSSPEVIDAEIVDG
jgi:hypothetical protein